MSNEERIWRVIEEFLQSDFVREDYELKKILEVENFIEDDEEIYLKAKAILERCGVIGLTECYTDVEAEIELLYYKNSNEYELNNIQEIEVLSTECIGG